MFVAIVAFFYFGLATNRISGAVVLQEVGHSNFSSASQWSHAASWLWSRETSGQVSLSYNGSCLDIANGTDVVQARLHLASCDPAAPSFNQRWTFSDGRIVHRRSDGQDLCVDIPDDDRSTGNRLQLWSCAGVDFPQQAFRYSGGLLMTQDGSTCLKVDDNSKSVQLSSCTGADSNQTWTMTALPKSTFLSQLRGAFRNVTTMPAKRV